MRALSSFTHFIAAYCSNSFLKYLSSCRGGIWVAKGPRDFRIPEPLISSPRLTPRFWVRAKEAAFPLSNRKQYEIDGSKVAIPRGWEGVFNRFRGSIVQGLGAHISESTSYGENGWSAASYRFPRASRQSEGVDEQEFRLYAKSCLAGCL
jgi:hypothetical protein